MKRLIISLLLFGCAGEAQAKPTVESRYTKNFVRCSDAASDIGERADCEAVETEIQDARLNQAYKMVMARLNPAQKAELRTSERAWIKRRDVTCEKQADDAMNSGSWMRVTYSSCILDETIKRTIFLESYGR